MLHLTDILFRPTGQSGFSRLAYGALVALSLATAGQASAQQNSVPLTMEDCFRPTKRPTTLRQLQWIPTTADKPNPKSADQLAYVISAGGRDVLVKRQPTGTVVDTLLRATDLSATAKALPGISLTSPTTGYAIVGQDVVTLDWTSGVLQKKTVNTLPEEADNADLSASNLAYAYTIGPNLYISEGGIRTPLSTEPAGTNTILFGHAAHQREFGITKGTFWSGDGKQLAFYRIDQGMVPEYPITDMASKPAKVNPLRYPMAGTASHHATLGVYNLSTKATVFINPGANGFGDPEQYLTNITWSPDNAFIYIAVVNRDQNHMKLLRFVASTGAFDKALFEERHPKYVEPEHGPMFMPKALQFAAGSGADHFVWMSERDGHNHLYLYHKDGQVVQQLTKGDFDVLEVSSIAQEGKSAIVNCQITANVGLDKHLARVTVMSGKPAQLQDIDANSPGVHVGKASPSGRYMVDAYSNPDMPYEVLIWDQQTKSKPSSIYRAANPLAENNVSKPELVRLTAEDGTPLHGRLIKPANMVPGKRYPTIVYVYGGPHAQLVTNGFNMSADLWMYHFAQEGYVVFTLDGRGSGNRGLNFENATHRQLGTLEMQDQLKGVEYLKQLPFVDAARMGVSGWSFGGFMTTSLMTRHPDVFKAGCAGGPVIDWSLYEIMYTERYMDRPQQNPEGYAANNLKSQAKNLKGKLMLIHGTVDDVVLWQHSQQMASQLIKDKKLFEYMIYPGHPHNVLGPDRVHLFRTIKAFFDRSL